NGMEWYFEAPTSHSIPKEVETKIVEQLDQFESQKNPVFLSAPETRNGLIWDGADRSYIKVNEQYIPLILLDKELNRYHLVKKDYHESMTVLRFDEKKDRFCFETELESKEVMEAFFSEQPKERQRKWKATSKKSKTRNSKEKSAPSTSKITSQRGLPPQNVIPDTTRHAEEWTKLRKAIPFQKKFEIRRVEDANVALGDFSHFLPEKTVVYYDKKEWVEKKLKSMIIKNLSAKRKRDFRVYVGLKKDTAPEYIKLFREKLVGEFKKAHEKCVKTKKTCDNLLKKRTLVQTRQGQYLIQLFQLEKATNQEEILREIIKKLRLIAEKGELFLQKTADLGFENILIVSTDLVRKKGTKEYRSVCRKNLSQGAVFGYDPECRILIYADAFHLEPDVKLGKETRPIGRDVILHEVTHHTVDSEDVVMYYPVDKKFSISAEDALNDYIDIYPNLLESKAFKAFVNHLAISLDKPTISIRTVAKEMETNFMLRANFQMTDAEMLMVLLRDLADGRAFNQRPRVKRSISEEGLEIESMFEYLAMKFVLGDGIFEKSLQFNKTQEQTTERTTENIGIDIPHTEIPVTVGNGKKMEAIKTLEITGNTTNRSFLNFVATSTENSNNSTQVTINKQIDNKPIQSTINRSFSDLVATSVNESNRIYQNLSNQQIIKNQKTNPQL
ncbi:MAG: hypothetical protein ACI32O_00280, partial [Enterococcus sp.]